MPADEKATAAAWQAWLANQHTTGNGAVPDYANPEQMNRYTWYQAHDWTVPYPGDTRIYAPDQVPGAPLPSSDSQLCSRIILGWPLPGRTVGQGPPYFQ